MNLVQPRLHQPQQPNRHLLNTATHSHSHRHTPIDPHFNRNLKLNMDLDDDSFYICTELTPRCFVVQKAVQIDRGQLERMVGDMTKGTPRPTPIADNTPPPPQLPYWFTPECRDNLMNIESPVTAPSPVPPSTTIQQPSFASGSGSQQSSSVDIKQQLKAQLEYYFSRENLITDRYLRCQMDADQYVPISIIAGFRKIVQLTTDYNLIKQVLRESNQVEVDERSEKVRPVCRRCTIIIREISEEHKDEIEKMLAGGPAYQDLKYGLNESWYITYENEEKTQKAYMHLQSLGKTFQGKPICARIKAGGPPSNAELANLERAPSRQIPSPFVNEAAPFVPIDQPQMIPLTPLMELGQVLASFGFVPRATYRPGATTVHVEEETETASSTAQISPQTGSQNNNNNSGSSQRNSPSPRGNNQNRRYQQQNGYYQPNAIPSDGNGLLGAYCPPNAASMPQMIQKGGNLPRDSTSIRGGRGFKRGGGGQVYTNGAERPQYIGGRRHTTSLNCNLPRDSASAFVPHRQTFPSSSHFAVNPLIPSFGNMEVDFSVMNPERISPIPMIMQPQQQQQNIVESQLYERPRYNTYSHHYERRNRVDENWHSQSSGNSRNTGSNTGRRVDTVDRRSERSDEATSSGEMTDAKRRQSDDGLGLLQKDGKRKESDRKPSSQSSAYSFEERAFPSLTEPKPEPVKPVEKPTFRLVVLTYFIIILHFNAYNNHY
ncbi:hypothetical protein WR25_05511 isoform D [Diploscapter pachys]|uniref:HTH La-type RNA-binding domain-containing protein n=1 Tax=Diploscapter pachys TaxID=2018661 RepID=A0A2A2KPP0_9BILA|nr:hypothetical protein WR25_05511 isoform D [Diploscapter pachys]